MKAREKAEALLLGGTLGLVIAASVWLAILPARDTCFYVGPATAGRGVTIDDKLP